MTITVYNVTDQASVQTLFDELYTSSAPYFEQDGNPWNPLHMSDLDSDTKKDMFTKAFFSVLDITGGTIVKIELNGVPISMLSGVIEDNLYKINYSMHNEFNGSRSWLYDRVIMEDREQKLRDLLQVIGYSFETVYDSSFYNYRKLNIPILDIHSSIIEETPENMPNVRKVTFLF